MEETFPASSPSSRSEKLTSGQTDVLFLNVWSFSEQAWFFPLRIIKESFFNEKKGSQQRVFHFLTKVTFLAIFDYLGSSSKSNPSTYIQNFRKSSVKFMGDITKNIVLNFQCSMFSGYRRGGARHFAIQHFKKNRDFSCLCFCGAAFCSLLCLLYSSWSIFPLINFWSLVMQFIFYLLFVD